MAFNVRLTEAATRDIAQTLDFITSRSPLFAQKWFDGLLEAMESLGEMPMRHALIAESNRLNRSLRGLIYYSHRVVYEIDDEQQIVSIVRIYHSARAPLRVEDLP